MHPFFANPSNIPGFLIKLWKLVADPVTDELIKWNQNGSSFIITDSERFSRELLPLYFKHSNTASFIRQLNIYGFRKVINYGKTIDSRELEFQHAFFSRNKIELLNNIKRKIAATKIIEPETSINAKDILTNITMMKEKQRIMESNLKQIKTENEVLWRELSRVVQKHKAQEQVLQKVIQFLVQIIQRSNQNINAPRKLARMLQDTVSQEDASQMARFVDSLRNEESDCIIVPDNTSDSVGAVIHEVTDFESDSQTSPQSSTVTNFNTSILKSLPKTSANTSVSYVNSSKSCTLEPLNILENLKNSKELSVKRQTSTENKNDAQMKFIDPNKLCFLPENLSNEKIINFSKGVIALPGKLDSSTNPVSSTSILDQISAADSTGDDIGVSNKCDNSHRTTSIEEFKSINTTPVSNYFLIENNFSDLEENCVDDPVPQDFDDCVLSELLQSSKISIDQTMDDTSMAEADEVTNDIIVEDSSICKPSESGDNQLAIPGPSSLIKSTKNCFPDFSILQETMKSTIDIKVLEQLFGCDDINTTESLSSQLPDDAILNMPSNDIIGNEVVPMSYPSLDDTDNKEHRPWFDFNPETWSLSDDVNVQFYCSSRDQDTLIQSDETIIPDIKIIKNETIFSNPLKNQDKNLKKSKKRKVH